MWQLNKETAKRLLKSYGDVIVTSEASEIESSQRGLSMVYRGCIGLPWQAR